MAGTLRQRFEDWVMRGQPPSHGPMQLTRRRIYILPTRYGYAFAVLLFVLFLWSVNYSNSMGFAFTFLLAAVALNSMWRTHDNLLGLVVHPGSAEPVFAGQEARFSYRLENAGSTPRYGVGVQWRDQPPQYVDVPAQGAVVVTLAIPAARRGWLHPGRIRILTRFPLGLLQSWSWVAFAQSALVYPCPRGRRPLPALLPSGAGNGWGEQGLGSEDYAGFRPYAPGDSPRRIAWKAATRSEHWLVKRFTDQARPELWLDWRLLGIDQMETRLEQLCQWTLQAENDGLQYGLWLPGQRVVPAHGDHQRRRCLEALALFHEHGAAESAAVAAAPHPDAT